MLEISQITQGLKAIAKELTPCSFAVLLAASRSPPRRSVDYLLEPPPPPRPQPQVGFWPVLFWGVVVLLLAAA